MKKNQVHHPFYIPKGERNGILIFLICSVSIIIGLQMYTAIKSAPVIINSGSPHTETFSEKKYTPKTKKTHQNKRSKSSEKRQIFAFNPNTISYDSLKLLGFSAFAAKNLLNYRNKGGKFKSKEQLYKIYGTDSLLIKHLEDHITLQAGGEKNISAEPTPTSPKNSSFVDETPKKPVHIVEINSADSAALVSIRGIGPFFAKKMIKMRQRLGGFSSAGQLTECNILPDSVFQKISPFITVDDSKMEKIPLNQASYKTLIQHPYFDENLVKVILNYRENHGPFTSPHQLKNIKILNKEKYEKIIKHFSFE
jgi:DNA uptake protein ComE-like DNA-binding protein